MAEADAAIKFVMSNEGGFVDNANDPGGATNFGLSLRSLREIPIHRLKGYGIFNSPESLGIDDVKNLHNDQAVLIYAGEFWDLAPFTKIENQEIANYLFDMSVLHGANQAIKLLQRAFWAFSYQIYLVKDDGILGEFTLGMINKNNQEDHNDLLSCMMAERAGFVRLLCVENPKNREFLDGWLNRCYRI